MLWFRLLYMDRMGWGGQPGSAGTALAVSLRLHSISTQTTSALLACDQDLNANLLVATVLHHVHRILLALTSTRLKI
jgi:hypothetical protein